jgi:transglutaminase-like putative cysteine protease
MQVGGPGTAEMDSEVDIESNAVKRRTLVPQRDTEGEGGDGGAKECRFEWVRETEYLDKSNVDIQETVKGLTEGCDYDKQKALAIFQFVRDDIRFGWTMNYHAMRASDVLRDGVGFSVTKCTLFVTLLRAAGIPARQVFVDISSQMLQGLDFYADEYIDHCYTEVYLGDKWIKVDSYIVDKQLYDGARRELVKSNYKMGYGLHGSGTCHWDGETDSFVQFVNDGSITDFTRKHWGPQVDAVSFYRDGTLGQRNNFSIFFPFTLIFYGFLLRPNEIVVNMRFGFLENDSNDHTDS